MSVWVLLECVRRCLCTDVLDSLADETGAAGDEDDWGGCTNETQQHDNSGAVSKKQIQALFEDMHRRSGSGDMLTDK